MAIEFSDFPAIQKIYFSLFYNNAEQTIRSFPPVVTNNLAPGNNIQRNIKTSIARKDFESLYSIKFAILNAFFYELLIISYKNRLYHICFIQTLPFRFKGFSPAPLA